MTRTPKVLSYVKIFSMKILKSKLLNVLSLTTVFGLIALAFPSGVLAASCGYDWDNAPDLGDYLNCAIPQIFGAFRTILVAIAIVFTLLLIYKMMTNTSNSKVMEEIPQKWLYLIYFVVLLVGGGTLVNIILKFLGFGGVDPWLALFTNMIDKL